MYLLSEQGERYGPLEDFKSRIDILGVDPVARKVTTGYNFVQGFPRPLLEGFEPVIVIFISK